MMVMIQRQGTVHKLHRVIMSDLYYRIPGNFLRHFIFMNFKVCKNLLTQK